MPMVRRIKVGGPGGQLGAGLGAGLIDGIDEKKEAEKEAELQAQRDAAAMEMNQATSALWRSTVDQQERELGYGGGPVGRDGPQQAAPQPYEGSGPPLPAHLVPKPDPDEAEFNSLVDMHDAALEGLMDPRARAAYLKVAQQDLAGLRGVLDGQKLTREIASAIAAETITEEEGADLLSKLQKEGASATQVYGEWGKLKQQKREQTRRMGSLTRAATKAQGMLDTVTQRIATEADPADRAHWENVHGMLEEEIGLQLFDAQNDPYGYDPGPGLHRLVQIKGQQTPAQMAETAAFIQEREAIIDTKYKMMLDNNKAGHAQELAKMKGLMDAMTSEVAEMNPELAAKWAAQLDGVQSPSASIPGATGDAPADLEILGRSLNAREISAEQGQESLNQIMYGMGYKEGEDMTAWLRTQDPDTVNRLAGAHQQITAAKAQSQAQNFDPQAPFTDLSGGGNPIDDRDPLRPDMSSWTPEQVEQAMAPMLADAEARMRKQGHSEEVIQAQLKKLRGE